LEPGHHRDLAGGQDRPDGGRLDIRDERVPVPVGRADTGLMTGQGTRGHAQPAQHEGHQRGRLGLTDGQQLVQLPRRIRRADVGGQPQQIIGSAAPRGNDDDQRPSPPPFGGDSQGGVADTVERGQRRTAEFLYEYVHRRLTARYVTSLQSDIQ